MTRVSIIRLCNNGAATLNIINARSTGRVASQRRRYMLTDAQTFIYLFEHANMHRGFPVPMPYSDTPKQGDIN